jgi:CheY-like chemotaxis protein
VSSSGIYSIGAVAAMTSVPPATLRTWEERYGVIVPTRSRGGHRLYSRDDVERLRFVAERVAEGLAPADAHRLLSGRHMTGAASPGDAVERFRMLILLAERDPYAAELSEYFLRTEGYDVVSVFDAGEAVATLTTMKPQVAVVDLLTSGGGGLDLCRRLAADRGPVVVAISTLNSRDDALEAGAAAFLLKPLDPLRLISTVRDLLGDSAYLSSWR